MTPPRSISTQMTLLGIRSQPSGAEIRALVRYKLAGFEIRQAWREQKRQARLNAARQRARGYAHP